MLCSFWFLTFLNKIRHILLCAAITHSFTEYYMFNGFLQLLSKIFTFAGAISNKGSFEKPLSPEDEKKYFKLFQAGDNEAKEILIKHNLRLVAHICKKFTTANAESDDLISVGTIGLIKAINTYSLDKGNSFATFAARCIENEILMLLRCTKKHRGTISLSEAVGSDKEGNELILMDLLYSPGESVIDQVENTLLKEKLLILLKNILTEREFTIICHRYGLNNRRCLTQREIAKALKISRSYISRIEKKALEKIRSQINIKDFNM